MKLPNESLPRTAASEKFRKCFEEDETYRVMDACNGHLLLSSIAWTGASIIFFRKIPSDLEKFNVSQKSQVLSTF